MPSREEFALSASHKGLHVLAGTAKHWIVLSHYAIVTRDPGGQAA